MYMCMCSSFCIKILYIRWLCKGVFKGGGVQPPPPEFSDFLLKSEGKEIERKRKKGMLGGGGLPLNIFLGLIFFRVGLRYFQGG